MKATDNAFPLSHGNCYDTGLTARDYIAIQAMAGLSANPAFEDKRFDEIADMAYEQADAMIERSEVKA